MGDNNRTVVLSLLIVFLIFFVCFFVLYKINFFSYCVTVDPCCVFSKMSFKSSYVSSDGTFEWVIMNGAGSDAEITNITIISISPPAIFEINKKIPFNVQEGENYILKGKFYTNSTVLPGTYHLRINLTYNFTVAGIPVKHYDDGLLSGYYDEKFSPDDHCSDYLTDLLNDLKRSWNNMGRNL